MNNYLLWLDTSHWVQLIASLLKAGGVRGVIAKATSGDYSQDARFIESQNQCYANQLMLACYHWNDPLTKPRGQADNFLRTIESWMPQQQFLAVDQEQWWANWAEWRAWLRNEIPKSAVTPLSANQINDTCLEILEILKAETDKKIVVYSNAFFVKEYCPQMFAWLPNYHQWWAQWPYDNRIKVNTTWDGLRNYYYPPTNNPAFPSGWQNVPKWDIWQFSGEKFTLPGCSGYSDLNFIKPEFLDITVPTPEPTPSQIYIPANINIRIEPWLLDWGTTKIGKTVPILGKKLDANGDTWYSVPAWVAGWLVKPK